MNAKFNFTNPRWILFGGSYAGSLVAWARELYPDVVYGAVSSSGPVQAVVDMAGYLEVVYHTLKDYDPECASSVRRGILKVNELIKNESGRSTLRQMFKLCGNFETDFISTFYGSIIGNYMHVVQYSQNNVRNYAKKVNVPHVCGLQTETSDGLIGMIKINDLILDEYEQDCVDVNYTSLITWFKNVEIGKKSSDSKFFILYISNISNRE
uniref:Serine carboxypeptidase n=1 Tax=Panagrolaimus sp. JU765 TaxID=591449 RepID=A0AC34PZY9_9BILA